MKMRLRNERESVERKCRKRVKIQTVFNIFFITGTLFSSYNCIQNQQFTQPPDCSEFDCNL